MEIYKIASRWNKEGDPNYSILKFFLKYDICFAYPKDDDKKKYFENVKEGDLVVIADGVKIVALGKTLTYAHPLPDLNGNFDSEDTERYTKIGVNFQDSNIMGMKVNIIKLKDENVFKCHYKTGRFCEVQDEEQKIENLWAGKEVDTEGFEINRKWLT